MGLYTYVRRNKPKWNKHCLSNYPFDAHVQPFANRASGDKWSWYEVEIGVRHKKLRKTNRPKPKSWKNFRKTQYKVKDLTNES